MVLPVRLTDDPRRPERAVVGKRPCRRSVVASNPIFDGSRGQGAKETTQTPLLPECFHEEPVVRNRGPLCGTGAEDSTLALESPRVGVEASGTVSVAWTRAPSRDLSTARPPGGQRGRSNNTGPSALPTRVPLDPVWGRRCSGAGAVRVSEGYLRDFCPLS